MLSKAVLTRPLRIVRADAETFVGVEEAGNDEQRSPCVVAETLASVRRFPVRVMSFRKVARHFPVADADLPAAEPEFPRPRLELPIPSTHILRAGTDCASLAVRFPSRLRHCPSYAL